MPSDPRKRQKKLQRRNAKRKEKKHLQVREQTTGLPDRLRAAARFPILHCRISKNLNDEDQGMGIVLLSRAFPNGTVAVASFLVDIYCLGVKDAHAEVLARADYDEKYLRQQASRTPMRDASPAEARKLVEEAVAYAHGIGLSPHADYARAALLFGDIDPSESDVKFTFGKDGKPFFISGPNDTLERCKQIQATLLQTCGPDGFHFVFQLGPQSRFDFPEEDEEDLLDLQEDGGQ